MNNTSAEITVNHSLGAISDGVYYQVEVIYESVNNRSNAVSKEASTTS